LNQDGDKDEDEDEDEDNLVDTEAASGVGRQGTFRERAIKNIRTLQDFCDGLEYQLQFDNHRMFQTMEREGATFMQFANSCLSCERCLNSARGLTPPTWDRSTASVMFYRARPTHRDIER
jgi:hypothetical protein